MKRSRILFIDNAPRILASGAGWLRRYAFEVIAVPGNDEALAHLERYPQGFDLLIQDNERPLGQCLADVGPPEELHASSGLLFLRRHVWRLNPGLPCLFATADSRSSLWDRDPGLRENSLFHFMSKPYLPPELGVVAKEILGDK